MLHTALSTGGDSKNSGPDNGSSASSVASLPEEIASTITHGIGAALSVAALTTLVLLAVLFGDGWRILSMSIYGFTLVFLYLASTLYHGIQFEPAKRLFLKLDHVGIAMLIAGTYTPILLIRMRTVQGWIFFCLIWTLALLSGAIKSFFTERYVGLTVICYAIMGGLSLVIVEAMTAAIGFGGIIWIVAGGLSYMMGIVPFMWHRLPFNHAIWHLFVIGGSVCHFLAILWYVLPMNG